MSDVPHELSELVTGEPIKMNVLLSFTRVKTGTLANARGLRFVSVLLIYMTVKRNRIDGGFRE